MLIRPTTAYYLYDDHPEWKTSSAAVNRPISLDAKIHPNSIPSYGERRHKL